MWLMDNNLIFLRIKNRSNPCQHSLLMFMCRKKQSDNNQQRVIFLDIAASIVSVRLESKYSLNEVEM